MNNKEENSLYKKKKKKKIISLFELFIFVMYRYVKKRIIGVKNSDSFF